MHAILKVYVRIPMNSIKNIYYEYLLRSCLI
jgi:hypothetical protein